MATLQVTEALGALPHDGQDANGGEIVTVRRVVREQQARQRLAADALAALLEEARGAEDAVQ
eukprot:2918922-Lingulodinium_polyedra.AAC.1